MYVGFHQLPLITMFAAILAIGLLVSWLLIGIVRVLVPRVGFWLEDPLPIRDSIINACGAVFALIVAFTAAGIWNDAAAARNAVQREADAIENAQALALSMPTETQAAISENLDAYAKDVAAIDWPAMGQGSVHDDPVFDRAEAHLLAAISLLSRQHATLGGISTYTALLNQLLDIRHARLARIAASNAGISWAQWIAMCLLSTVTLLAITICNSHSFRMQIVATHLYVLVASAAYFVILTHDRPFIGTISIQPTAMQRLAR